MVQWLAIWTASHQVWVQISVTADNYWLIGQSDHLVLMSLFSGIESSKVGNYPDSDCVGN